MIEEAYVSYKTARLLKEKGFDEVTIGYYSPEKELNYTFLGETNSSWLDKSISAPTLQMAMRWLRKVHKLHIEPHIQSYKNYNGNIYNLDGELLLGFTGESPEQACEAAIKYCLENLI